MKVFDRKVDRARSMMSDVRGYSSCRRYNICLTVLCFCSKMPIVRCLQTNRSMRCMSWLFRSCLIRPTVNSLPAENFWGAPYRRIQKLSIPLVVISPDCCFTLMHSEYLVPVSTMWRMQNLFPLMFINMKSACTTWLEWWHTCVRDTFLQASGSPDRAQTGHECVILLHNLEIPGFL